MHSGLLLTGSEVGSWETYNQVAVQVCIHLASLPLLESRGSYTTELFNLIQTDQEIVVSW